MANNINVRRHVVQVSEIPVAPAVQTLGVVGNDVCTVTQQDLRKVVDFRMFTLSPCQPIAEAAASTILLDLFSQEPPKKTKLANNPYIRREVLKVSETPMAPAVHIPIVVGCQQYVVIQQDIRKEVDIRMFTYSRLGPVASAAAPLNVFGCPVTNMQPPLFLQAPQVPLVTINPYHLQPQIPEKPTNDVALGRSNHLLCYSTGTSTDGLMKNNGCQHCPKCVELHCQTQTSLPSLDENSQKNVGCQTQPDTSCTGCNTSSSMQMVRKVKVEEKEEEDEDPCHPCTDRELFVQQGPVVRNQKFPQEEPCTSRLMDMEDRRRYDCIRARICAQRLAEFRRQRQQDCDTSPPPTKKWLQNYEDLNRERRQRNNR